MQADLPPPTPEIIVTARALPDAAAERLLGVTVIGADRLSESGPVGLEQLLRDGPGVQLFRRSDARSGQPTSQGVTLRALGGNAASRALLILDGVPQSDPFGGWINWPAYDPASLAQVRILRGGGSVADGPGALAGTIRMISRDVDGVEAGLEAGSRGGVSLRAQAGGELGGGRLSVATWAGQGDGFVPIEGDDRGPADRRSPYDFVGGRVRWSAEVAPEVRLQAALSGFADARERGIAFTRNDTHGVDASLRLVGTGGWGWSALVYGQRRQFESSFASTNALRSVANRTALQDHVPGRAVGWSAEVRPPVGQGLEVRFGTDGRLVRGRSEELAGFAAGTPARARRAGGAADYAGLFAEATRTVGPLTLSTTARIDRWHIHDGELIERLIATGQPVIDQRPADRSGWRPTARAAAGLTILPGLQLRGAAYLGWRLPTLNELYRPFRAGPDATAANPDLAPERLRGVEGGIDWEQGDVRLGVTVYANRLADPVANVTLASGPGSFPGVGFVSASGVYRQRRNLDAISVRGVEIWGGWRRGAWSVDASAGYADAEVLGSGLAAPLDGLRPAQTPRLTAALGARWEDAGRSVGLQLRHVGRQYEDDLNRVALPPATTVDGIGAWPLGRRVTAILRVENLFDARVIAGETADGVTERATPRTIWAGLRFSLRN
ncbi:TonB-dependent receptor [Sphingomonas sp. LHG3406-1]|uniref:TonB-dependent receptor n=1 Tax=Sphingomonas sp. LHG3406-1 TaxID=2804617 RepID=UPI0026135724|nr:TonB-dependent receptor [Sphingomonas sp. LHG3406-1]